MFSIWTKGIAEALNRMAGDGTARFASLLKSVCCFIRTIVWESILAQSHSILECFEQVTTSKPFSEGFLDPVANLIRSTRSILVHAQFAHVLIER
jgi:hypothetical protein